MLKTIRHQGMHVTQAHGNKEYVNHDIFDPVLLKRIQTNITTHNHINTTLTPEWMTTLGPIGHGIHPVRGTLLQKQQ